MAHVRADFAKNYTATTGTGTYTLGTAVTGFRSMTTVLSNSDTTTYAVVGADSTGAAAWEVAVGTYTTSGTTLARTTILASSTGSAINWGAGNKTIYITDPEDRTFALDAAGTGMVGLPTNLTLTGLTGTLTLPGTTLVSSQTTFSLLNTTTTTLNIGGAATTISIGAATGTLTIANATTTISGALSVAGNTTLGNASTDTATINGTIYLGATAGAESLRVLPTTSSVNYVQIRGAASGSQPAMEVAGSDTNIPLLVSTKGTGPLNIYTNTFGTLQLQVTHTASANRNVIITGSNGGNPTIGTSAGSLAISSALVLSQTTLLSTSVSLTDGAAAAAGTLLNAPTAGNPTKWFPINDNGTTRYVPAW